MIFNSEMLSNLRASVKARLSAKRYEHTIGVEAMAIRLGWILMPDKIYELRAAALLHDISKEIPYEEQVDLLSKSTVVYTDEDLSVKPALHSISAVPIIEKDFAEFAASASATSPSIAPPEKSVCAIPRMLSPSSPASESL